MAHLTPVILPASLLLAAGAARAQTTLFVNHACGNDAWTGLSDVCDSPDGPKATIQSAIDAAPAGARVIVAPGVYTGPGNKNLSFHARPVVLRSAEGPSACTIDCENDGRGFFFQAQGATPIIVEGFTVVHGYVDDTYPGGRKGGAVFCLRASPVLINCILDDNRGHTGGAVYCGQDAHLTVANSRITNHVGTGAGDETDIHLGAGLFARDGGTLTIINCTIADNRAAEPGHDHLGGGVYVKRGSSALIMNSVLWGNHAVEGDQIAVTEGGSVTVVRSNVQGGEAGVFVDASTLLWGVGNIDTDPMFTDPAALDYRPAPGSPCIDAGDNSAVPPDAADIDNDADTTEPIPLDANHSPRFTDDPAAPDSGDPGDSGLPVIDMGAWEQPAPCRADFNLDGSANTLDVLAFLNAWTAGDPRADFNLDGTVNTLDVLAFLNAWTAGC